MQVAERFAGLLAPLGPFEPAPVLAIALSGGSDSLALTLLADQWARAQGGRVVALTVDHQLRPESGDEAQQVARWMQHRGIEHHILTPMHTPAGNNLMQAARQWRYRALAEWCRLHAVLHCLVGHQQEDQLETALLHTTRGSTEDGAAGMSAIRLYRGVRFLRPLLDTPREALREYLRQHGTFWIEDPTNANPDYARTRARMALADLPSGEALRLYREHAALRMARESEAARVAMQCVRLHPAGYAELRMQPWRDLAAPMRSLLLADLIACIGGHIHRPRHHETAWLEKGMAAPKGKQTLGNCLVEWSIQEATISREPARCEPPITLKGHGTVLWDQRFRIHYQLDTPLTLGALGSKGRAMVARPLPLATPALWHLDDLHSVPHIGWSAADPLPRASLSIGFAPAKPLAASAYWWFTASH